MLSIDAHTLFRRMNRNLTPMVVQRGDTLWSSIPHKGMKSNTKLWTSVPLVIGHRLIGTLVLWRTSEFKGDEWNRLIHLTTEISPAVETLITFAEMAGHLKRLALLNEFSLTVSTGRNLDQIARRMFALLSRAFTTEMIVLYLLSSDNRLLNEYRSSEGDTIVPGSGMGAGMTSTTRSVEEHRIAPLLKSVQKLRLDDIRDAESVPLYEGAQSGLYVPLRFRGQEIGILCIEAARKHWGDAGAVEPNIVEVYVGHLRRKLGRQWIETVRGAGYRVVQP